MRRTAQLKSFLPWAGITLLCCVLAVWMPLLFGCKSLARTGSCVGIGTDFSECYEDWDRSDCESFADNNVNGHDWYFYPGESCSDRGYPYWCSEYGSGYYSQSSWDCIYN
jgi:hypothetical protein